MKKENFDVIVIGAGPAGYVAAIRCAQLGLKTVCVDEWTNYEGKASPGGTCLNVGCIPSKALLESSHIYSVCKNEAKDHGVEVKNAKLNLTAMMARKQKILVELSKGVEQLLKSNGVEIVYGHARFASQKNIDVFDRTTSKVKRSLDATSIIIAAGSSVVRLDRAPLTSDLVVDSAGALEFDAVPKTLGIIGAGAIGLELGSVWSRLGSKVILIETMDSFLPGADDQVSKTALRILRKQGLDIRLAARLLATDTSKGKVQVKYEDSKGEQTEVFDKLIVAVGRKPNSDILFGDDMGIELDERSYILVNKHCETTVQGIYAIGDIVRGPMLAHKGSEEGIMVAERIAGNFSEVNYDSIPFVIYTHPEIAWTGKTEQALTSSNEPCNVGVFPFAASGRAKAANATDGFVKIIAHAETDRILGVHIIGAQASELIAQAVSAIEMGASSEDLALTMFAHPTMSEAIHEAALALHGRALHLPKK